MEQRAEHRRRGRPRGANSDDTKARILDAAAAEFGEHGYEGASIRSIARRADVDPSLVHHYFDDKSALAAAVESSAVSILDVIAEVATARVTERGATRADDRFSEAAMEDRKRVGYF